jgi:hypothetical protein
MVSVSPMVSEAVVVASATWPLAVFSDKPRAIPKDILSSFLHVIFLEYIINNWIKQKIKGSDTSLRVKC